MTNPRMSITLTEPQMEYLTKHAARRGASKADMVRLIIDLHCLYVEGNLEQAARNMGFAPISD